MTTETANPLRHEARRYVDGGLSLVTVDREKHPLGKWKHRQTEAATIEEIVRELRNPLATGVAAVGGAVSGGLLAIDFDEPGFYEQWLLLVGDEAEGLPVQRTGGACNQVWLRCDDPGRNTELAYVPDETEDSGRRIAIETRGEGGYAVAPGSLHPSGNRYAVVSGDFADIPHREQTSVDYMLERARELCQAPFTRQELSKQAAATPKSRANLNGQVSVIDEWNKLHPIGEVLRDCGYKPFGSRFTRPGNDASPGGVVILDGRSFHHSSNDPLHDAHVHDSFDVHTFYKHNGDLSAAVKAAAAELGIAHKASDANQSEQPSFIVVPQFQSARQLRADHPHLRAPIIHGLLREGETANVIAPSKRGKSWMVLLWALSIAIGRMLFGRFAVEQGDVLIIDNELHPETVANRLPRVAEALRMDPADWMDHVHVDCLRGRLVDLYRMERYFDAIEPGRFKVIILDAWYRFQPRDSKENDNGELAAMYNFLDRMAARLRCAFILIHHASKGVQSEKQITDIGAGAGAQSRAADAHLVLRDHEEENVVVFDGAVRSWPPIDPFCIKWDFPLWTVADDLDPADLRKAPSRRKPKDNEPAEPKPEPWTLERFARSFITPEPQDQKTVLAEARIAGISGRAATDFVALAVKRGLAHRWAFTGKTVYLADRVQPVTAAEPVEIDVCTHARTPHTPRGCENAPRGEGERERESTPSPAEGSES